MATATTCKAPFSVVGLAVARPLRKPQSLKTASTCRIARSNLVFAAQMQPAPASREVESLPYQGDVEDEASKVFADDTEGIVCYRTETGEVICEGMDEGPHFYPPCGANFYIPDTRAAAILPLLGEVMYEI